MAMDEATWSKSFCMYYRDSGEHLKSDSGRCPGCGRQEK